MDIAPESDVARLQPQRVCVYSETGLGGYRCSCNTGYQGNPYIGPGCTDINEREDENPCDGICNNFLGGYTCTCPHGQIGDDKKPATVASLVTLSHPSFNSHSCVPATVVELLHFSSGPLRKTDCFKYSRDKCYVKEVSSNAKCC